MNASKVKMLIDSLGLTHTELIEKSIVPDDDLLELFPGIDELYLEPEVGVELSFWEETECFESLHFTLQKTTPSTVEYKGELPAPYSLKMNHSMVRELFGEPLEYSGPVIMPEPMGRTGGWEYYALDPVLHPDKKVLFKYLESMEVSSIVFTLVDVGHG